MTLEQLSKTVDFVQDVTPSNANDGETYLDTSQSPPQLKVFDGSAGAFVRPRSIQNLDAPVSGAGATQTDIETAVDNSNTGTTVSSNLDAKVSNAGKGVDWSSKTPKASRGFAQNASDNILSVSGSGYITGIIIDETEGVIDVEPVAASVSVDGTKLVDGFAKSSYTQTPSGNSDEGPASVSISNIYRFDSSFSIDSENNTDTFYRGSVSYVLD